MERKRNASRSSDQKTNNKKSKKSKLVEAYGDTDILWDAFSKMENEPLLKKDMIEICSTDEGERTKKLFPPISKWAIAEDDEPQTFKDFNSMKRYKLNKTRRFINLVQIGNLPMVDRDLGLQSTNSNQDHADKVSIIELFKEFCEAYFCLPVKILPPLTILGNEHHNKKKKKSLQAIELKNDNDPETDWTYPVQSIKSKDYNFVDDSLETSDTKAVGIDTTIRLYDMDVLRIIKEFLPSDGYCVFGVTANDIYEFEDDMSSRELAKEKSDIQIMGRGTGDRVGMVSLFRFDPLLEAKSQKKATEGPLQYSREQLKSWFLRTAKTLAHELMHVMGIDHCMYFSCCMNGCVAPDHLAEEGGHSDDNDPFFLCPIDLRKLKTFANFDIVKRYQNLLAFFEKYNSKREVDWLKERLDIIKGYDLEHEEE